MKKIILAVFISSLALHAVAQTNSAETEAANKALLGCLFDTSAQLDDGISSVETISRVVAKSCGKESTTLIDIMIRGIYPIDREKLLQASYEKNINTASYFILRIRAAKK